MGGSLKTTDTAFGAQPSYAGDAILVAYFVSGSATETDRLEPAHKVFFAHAGKCSAPGNVEIR